jgi:integrase
MASIEKRQQNNQTIYRVKVRLKGFASQTASFERLGDAKKWAMETEASIRKGQYFKNEVASNYTAAEAIDRFIENVLPLKPKMAYNQRAQLKWWRREIGQYDLINVTPAVISQCKDKLIKGVTPQGNIRTLSTANRYLAALSHVFTFCYQDWGWINENPFAKVNRFKEPRGRVRFLSDEERNALLQSCKLSQTKELYPIVVLALSTGARKNELLSLKWGNVDLERKVIRLEETKNDERRKIPLRGHALELLTAQAALCPINRQDLLLFPRKRDPSKPMHIRGAFIYALQRAKITDFTFHDLRHCAASYLAMNGASLAEIAEVLGHKTLSMVKRYAHLSDAHTGKVVEAMNNKMFAGTTGIPKL